MVMAKAPVPGRVKTRLCPPCTPEEAAALAEAALADTLEAVAGCHAERRIVALDGPPGPWLPPGFELIEQRGEDFAERLTHAWTVAGGPGVQIGMDTPQVTSDLLDECLASLDTSSAALGLADDGGWWAIGLRRSAPDTFRGIPMSRPDTGRLQLSRLCQAHLDVTMLATLTDFDTVGDLSAVAAAAPTSKTALLAARMGLFSALEMAE